MKWTHFFIIVFFCLAGWGSLSAAPRELRFSGYTWRTKYSSRPKAPGPNIYSNSESAVRVDQDGALHLTIGKLKDNWYCSEVFSRTRFGYGTYTVKLSAPLQDFPPSVVLGLFTYDNSDSEQYYQEIDIEFSRWGDAESFPGHFTVQPYTVKENTKSFPVEGDMTDTTHIIRWTGESVSFLSYVGHGEAEEKNLLQSWTYTGEYIPRPGKPTFRMNLWLFQAQPPSRGVEVIIRSFSFQPE